MTKTEEVILKSLDVVLSYIIKQEVKNKQSNVHEIAKIIKARDEIEKLIDNK